MSKYVKKRKRQVMIKLLLLLITIVAILILVLGKNGVKKPVNDTEIKEIAAKATSAWSEAYLRGKKTQEELELYVLNKLEIDGIDIDKYYITVTERGVTTANKPQGLLVEPGCYKAGTNYTEILKTWEQLENEDVIRVQSGKLLYFKSLEEPMDIVLDSSIIELKDKAFYQTENIRTVVIPDSVTLIGNNVFKESSIKEVILGTGITQLTRTFEGMESLEKILFTSSVTTISDYTFSGTKALKVVSYIGDTYSFFKIVYTGNEGAPACNNPAKLYINGVLVDEIVVPEGITEINDYSLYNYTNITSIVIPRTVQKIGVVALAQTSIDTIMYEGTKDEWNNILKNESWDGDNKKYIVYCENGKI